MTEISTDPRQAQGEISKDESEAPGTLTLWKMLRKHGVGLYAAQMICNDVMLNGVSLPISRPLRGGE